MNELASFYFENNLVQDIRILDRDDTRWFVAADVCKVLDIKQSGHTFDDFPENEKGWYIIPTLGGPQKMLEKT